MKKAIEYPEGKFERLINLIFHKELGMLLEGEVTTSISGQSGSAYFSLRLSSSIITDDYQTKGEACAVVEFRLSDHENGRYHGNHINITACNDMKLGITKNFGNTSWMHIWDFKLY